MAEGKQRNGIDKAFLLDTILNTTSELIVLVDREGYIEEISQPYAEFIGVKKENIQVDRISDNAMEYMKLFEWPGNVRELENVLERAVNFLGNQRVIGVEHLPARITGIQPNVEPRSLREIMD